MSVSETKAGAVKNLQDLADLAGVSRATASRALNDNPRISQATRDKIQALARDHGYAINRRARDFRLQRTGVIAVVFMLDIESKQHMSDLFFLDMLGGIADSLAERDYDLLLARAPVLDVRDLNNSRMLNQSDGAIFIGQGEQHEQLNNLARQRSSLVVWGEPVPGKQYVLVGSNNEVGGYQAATHLVAKGRRKIAFFGSTGNPENAARFAGYQRALAEHGLEFDPTLKFDIPFDMEAAQTAIPELLQSSPDFDAVMCVTDVMAMATLSALQHRGTRVPEDIAVVGYDDISLAAYSSPPLTTVRQHIREAGAVLVDSVLGLINGNPVKDTLLDTELIVRRSSDAKG